MFEFENEFLMGPKSTIERGLWPADICSASRAAEDELAQPAASPDKKTKMRLPSEDEQIRLVEDAPALDFNLEDELTKAFQNQEPEPSTKESDDLLASLIGRSGSGEKPASKPAEPAREAGPPLQHVSKPPADSAAQDQNLKQAHHETAHEIPSGARIPLNQPLAPEEQTVTGAVLDEIRAKTFGQPATLDVPTRPSNLPDARGRSPIGERPNTSNPDLPVSGNEGHPGSHPASRRPAVEQQTAKSDTGHPSTLLQRRSEIQQAHHNGRPSGVAAPDNHLPNGPASLSPSAQMPSQGMKSPPEEKPAMDFNDMIAEELDRALAEEVAAQADGSKASQMQQNVEPGRGAEPKPTRDVGEIDAEFSQLLREAKMNAGARQVPHRPTPPPPAEPAAPWHGADFILAPKVPEQERARQEKPAESAYQPFQMSDFDTASSLPDSQAMKPGFDPVLDVEQITSEASDAHIDSVLGGAEALASAALHPAADAQFDGEAMGIDMSASQATGADQYFTHELSELTDGESLQDQIDQIDQRASRKTGHRAAIAIVAVALLGGTAALVWNMVGGGQPGETPTLMASNDPVKVKPENAGGKLVPNQDQAVYQARDASQNQAVRQDRLKDDQEQPIAVTVAPSGSPANSRVLGAQGKPGSRLGAETRVVRTVVVKPDGTIVNSIGNKTDSGPATANQPASGAPTLLQPRPAATEDVGPSTIESSSASSLKQQDTASNALPGVSLPDIKIEPAPEASTPAKVEELNWGAPKPAEPQNIRVAKVPDPQPKPETKPAASTTNLPSAKSPFAVQVSSQRSAEAAQQTYANLSRRYASVIGGKGVDIQKAVIQGKGTYYRVRIPAQSRAEANSMCRALKSAGGDCFVTR